MGKDIYPNIYLAKESDVEKERGITINFSGNILERFKNAAKNNKLDNFKFKANAEFLIFPIVKSIPDPTLLVIQDKDGNLKQAPIINGQITFL